MIKLREYLHTTQKKILITESKISKSDRNFIYSILEKPKNIKFIMKSYGDSLSDEDREVDITLRNNSILTFSYNMELYDFTETLVDILDTLRLKFKSYEEKSINIINIEIQL